MNKTIIYTVITGNYDTIKQPLVVEEGVEYVLFTNNPKIIEAGVWKVVQILSEQWQGRTERENNILLSRKVKMLAHKYLPDDAEWGFEDDLGISENGLLIRRHNDARVIALMELWWEEYQKGCLRDQVSLMPCMYRTDFMPYFQFIEMDIRKNEFVEVMRHKVDK